MKRYFRYMSELKLPAKRGNFVEFRSGIINICPVGRSCTQAEREQVKLKLIHLSLQNIKAYLKSTQHRIIEAILIDWESIVLEHWDKRNPMHFKTEQFCTVG